MRRPTSKVSFGTRSMHGMPKQRDTVMLVWQDYVERLVSTPLQSNHTYMCTT